MDIRGWLIGNKDFLEATAALIAVVSGTYFVLKTILLRMTSYYTKAQDVDITVRRKAAIWTLWITYFWGLFFIYMGLWGRGDEPMTAYMKRHQWMVYFTFSTIVFVFLGAIWLWVIPGRKRKDQL